MPADRAEDRSPVARYAAIAGLIFVVAIVAFLMFGGSDRYGVTARFENAGQLVKGNNVTVGGRPVGTITDIALTSDGNADVRMELKDEAVPLHEGTRATIRATSLSGIANRYVSLQPGPNNGKQIADGGRIGADETNAPVDLDQLFNTFDPDTRKALQDVVRGSATQIDGKAKEASRSLKYLNPALSTTSRLTQEIALDDKVFERFVVDASGVMNAIAERRDDLSGLVQNAGTTAQAIGDENQSLEQTLALAPSTLRRANTTFVNLRSTLDDLDTLVAESKPATRELAPFLRELRPLVADARPTIRDLRELITQPGPGNDLINLTARMPRLEQLTSRVFPRTIRALRRAQPVLEYARNYTPDLAGWFEKFGHGAANYDANGHFARIQPIFGGFQFTDNPTGGILQAVTGGNRLPGAEFGNDKRCPGGAVQPPPDGSAPRPVEDCDPNATPRGG